ncbi:MAG: histidine--tRNA ligase family protein [Dehalococcoidia bacterium]|nr:histidine--tRNA ligase family protein [Dehalococcoidia bacterium]
MESQRCKGARDLLPDDMERFRQVEDAFRNSCLNWGYREIRTPTLEYIHLFTAAGTLTPSMLGRVYSFLDWDGWGGERVVLRPDGTIPAARLYSENLADQKVARLYYITNVFAFEETGRENREKWQCGVELLGDCDRASDAEVIALALEIAGAMGLAKPEIKLSHAGILKALIGDLRLDGDSKAALLDDILEGNWQAFAGVKSKNKEVVNAITSLIKLKGKSSGFLANLKAMPAISKSVRNEIDGFAAVTALLDKMQIGYSIDFTSIRGFEYYTGLCFKITSGGDRICSGGRYDNLIGLVGGRDIPACGFAFYLDTVTDKVKPWSKQKAEKTVSVKASGESAETVNAAFEAAAAMRNVGLIAELNFCGNQLQARWSVSVGTRPASLTLVDNFTKTRRKASTVGEVINIIGGFNKLAT